jgi:hypothetical protein
MNIVLPLGIENYLRESGLSATDIIVLKKLLEENLLTLRELAAKTGKGMAVESVVALGVPCRTIGVMSVKSASLATESQGVPVTTSDDTSDGGGAEAPNIERLLVVSSNGHSSGQGHSNDYIGHVLANSGGGDHGGSVGSSSAIIVVPF